uniref:Conotoxin n=1 Tax=Conus andremenezi TaxID=1077466 RepID=A0A291C223_9COND|nr:conotoxin [Conus andremenezi]
MWSGKDQATFLALVLMVVWALGTTAESCSPDRINYSDFEAASGVWYLILSRESDERYRVSGLDLNAYRYGGKLLVDVSRIFLKRTTRGCEKFTTRCEVSGNTCVDTTGYHQVVKYYIVALDANYLVVHRTLQGNPYTLDIYSRTGVGRRLKHLPQYIRDAIEMTCGKDIATIDSFWPGKYSPGDFISNCF